jgi:hypothetical protein
MILELFRCMILEVFRGMIFVFITYRRKFRF